MFSESAESESEVETHDSEYEQEEKDSSVVRPSMSKGNEKHDG